MKLSIRDFAVILIVAVVTVALLWGGQRIYRNSAIQSPLIRSIETVPGVRSATLTALGGLKVQFQPYANLMVAYQAVESRARLALNRVPNVIVESAGDGKLSALANQVRLVVAQGEATGQYVAMSQQIATVARQAGARERMTLGNYNVFVTLWANGHYVDQVIPLGLGGAHRG